MIFRRKARKRKSRGLVFWPLVVGFLILTVGGASILNTVWDSTTEDYVTFQGQLQKTTDVIDVPSPADARIVAVMVDEGSEVQAGQPLAKAVQEGLEERRASLLEEATKLAAEVRCLQTDIVFTPQAESEQATGAVAQQDVTAVVDRERCALNQERMSVVLNETWNKTAVLEERLALLDRFWHLARRESQRPDGAANDNAEALQKVLKIALARNLVRNDLSSERNRARAIALEIKEARVARLEAAGAELEEVLNEIEEVEELRAEIVIRAPRTGTIRNIRSGLKDKTVPKDTTIMRIVYGEGDLSIRVHIDETTYDHLRAGDPARLRIAALPADTPLIEGEIDRLFKQENETPVVYIAEIALNEEGRAVFDKQFKHGIEPGIWSDVEIEIGQHSPFDLALGLYSRQGSVCQTVSDLLPLSCSVE